MIIYFKYFNKSIIMIKILITYYNINICSNIFKIRIKYLINLNLMYKTFLIIHHPTLTFLHVVNK